MVFMRIITCASYYGTGSSAITDFFSECENIFCMGNYEYRFLNEPDGIADLEYNIIENNHRHNTSDAIKRYLKYVNSLKTMGYGGYDIFGRHFEELTERFISDITELKTHTWWNKDRIDKGQLFCFIDRCYSFAKRILSRSLCTEKKYSLLQHREWGYYTAISEDKFLAAVRNYVDDLLQSANKENLPYIMVDQMVPPTNTGRYIRYFNDVKAFVVDRDPRDTYLLEKIFWQWGIIPVDSVEEYVEWFKITRKYAHSEHEDSERILRIQFEDMIYKYEDMRRTLLEFAGISESAHVRPQTKFNPEISIRNTNLKKRINGYEKDIEYIEKNLRDYLYDFNQTGDR